MTMATGGFRPAGMSDSEDSDDSIMGGYQGAAEVHCTTEKVSADDIWRSKLNFDKDDSNENTKANVNHFQSVDDMYAAISNGNVERVRELLNQGVSCDECLMVNFGSSGRRPIFIAAEEGQVQILELLLDFQCRLDAEEGNFTPLMSTCGSIFQDREEALAKCVHLLTGKGKMDPNACQTQKITGLMLACKHGHDEIVKKLLEIPSLNINFQDSQRWTALMYAIDSDHGHIARRLLEAGARPDLAGLDGVLPVDLAMTKNNTKLQAIVTEYSKIKGIDLNMNANESVMKYSEVDNILLAVNANEYLQVFKNHQVDLAEFLLLDENDLIKIGVEKVGLRKKILDVIADMHKRQWEKSSVPKIQPKDKQNGIYLTAPDGALLISTVGHHLKLLNSNVEFLARHIREKPQMLQLGNDVASVKDIAKFTMESRQNLLTLSRTISKLEAAVTKRAAEKDNIPIDSHNFTGNSSMPPHKLSVIAVSCLTLFSAGAVYYLKQS